MKYEMTCSCGDMRTVEAPNRAHAVETLKRQMSEDMADHLKERHPGHQRITKQEFDRIIEGSTRLAAVFA